MRREDRQASRTRPAAARGGSRLAAFVLALALLSSTSQGQALTDLELRCARTLDGIATPAGVEAASDELTALGSPSIPLLFSILREGRYASLDDQDDRIEAVLTAERERALRRALRELPRTAVTSHLREVAVAPAPLDLRRVTLSVLAPIARTTDLRFLFRLCEPVPPEEHADSVCAGRLREGLVRILEEDREAYRSLRSVLSAAHADLRSPTLHAITEVPGREAFLFLSELLGEHEDLHGFLLSGMGRVARELPLPAEELALARVRPLLASEDPQLVREAALVLGRVEDQQTVPRLIDLLEDENPGVVSAAHWSLRCMSGLDLRADPVRWRTWLAEERAWWRDHAPEVLGWLRSPEPVMAKRGIAIAVQRRHRRHELALEIASLLDFPDEDVVRRAVRALGMLESRAALPRLLELCSHGDESLRDLALETYGKLGGERPTE